MLNNHHASAWVSILNHRGEVQERFRALPGGSIAGLRGGVISPIKNTDEDFEDEDFLDDEEDEFDDELDDEADADVDEFEDDDDAEDVDLDEDEEL